MVKPRRMKGGRSHRAHGPRMRPNDAVAMFEALAARPGAALADAALLARVYLAADRPADVERAWRGARFEPLGAKANLRR